jgi:NADP-dependent 3-hydroxy acid dehydrogenase YdfG
MYSIPTGIHSRLSIKASFEQQIKPVLSVSFERLSLVLAPVQSRKNRAVTFERSSKFYELLSIPCSVQWAYFENGSIVPSGRGAKENIMSGIKGKVVVITGASSGIGEATALQLAERGAKVVLGARSPDRLEALAARIASSGGEAAYARTDVKRREDVSNLVGLATERYGKLDVLVNNAGVAPISLLDELRVDDWEEMIDVNLKGVLYGIAAALPVFRRQSFGHFVNVISTAGIQIIPTMAVYAGTKNAVRTITETLRQEAGDKLRVTSISPGFVQTNLANSMTNPGVKTQIAERMEKMAIPPAAIARAIAFAIEQPAEVDVNEIVIRPTAQA